jgi:hypothetical protein
MDSIHDALAQSAAGRKLLVEVKTQKEAPIRRRQQVIDLIRAGFPNRPDILYHARSVARTGQIIRAGGQPYVELVQALEYASVDRVKALGALGLLK